MLLATASLLISHTHTISLSLSVSFSFSSSFFPFLTLPEQDGAIQKSPPRARLREFSFLQSFNISSPLDKPTHALLLRGSASFSHAQVRASGTISGPLTHPHEILLRGFGHRVRDPTLTQATILGVWDSTLLQDDWFGHSCRQLWVCGHFAINAKQTFVGP